MIKKIITMCAVTIVIGSSISCSSTADKVLKGNDVRPLLWELKNGDRSIYIAGSIHIAPGDIYPLDDSFYQAIENSDHFVLEADASLTTTPEFQKFIIETSLLPDNDDLANYVDENHRRQITEILTPYNMTFEHIRIFKPWMVSAVISDYKTKEFGYSSENGVDIHLQAVADEMGLDTMYLESAESQILLRDSYPKEYQIAELISTIDNVNTFGDYYENLISAWKLGDTKRIKNIIDESLLLSKGDEFLDLLFYQRNKNWLEAIEGFLETNDNYFIVVGAGHLVGDGSLINLLKDKEYDVNRL
ncbi:TraB/GumN family protein [Thiospirochaeta perfilievii]|uniref:TraB/GumN family protein n=1 Tax=Thiospirochaeta perfilievii TaxID=252967 RepID=UPI001658D47F|nr:TraB/GumN family protein [Thiospirochaeta perfilievii]